MTKRRLRRLRREEKVDWYMNEMKECSETDLDTDHLMALMLEHFGQEEIKMIDDHMWHQMHR